MRRLTVRAPAADDTASAKWRSRVARRPLLVPALCVPALVAVAIPFGSVGPAAPVVRARLPVAAPAPPISAVSVTPAAARRCPWIAPAAAQRSPDQLAGEVLAQMTNSEKLGLVNLRSGHGYENHNRGVARLCIPALTLQDGPVGLAYNDPGVTQLPSAIALAATFDPSLARRYGALIGAEARAQGIDVVQGPVLNLDRVPTSGRSFETFGEDPFLASEIGVGVVRGIQSQGVMAEVKHLTAYTQETGRLQLDQILSERALEELYLRPFQAAVTEGDVAAMMCAYGRIDGTYACADPQLFATVAGWGFTGFIRSDLGAVPDPVVAFRAGLDAVKPAAQTVLANALADGSLSESRLDGATRSILREMFAFHMIGATALGRSHALVRDAAGTSLAAEVAARSTVLLKNDRSLLPLAPGSRLAVIGDDAAAGALTAGYGSAHVLGGAPVTPLAALERTFGTNALTFAGGASPVTATLAPLALRVTGRLLAKGSRRASAGYLADGDARIVAPHAGTFTVSITDSGQAEASIDGRPVYQGTGPHLRAPWSFALTLSAGSHDLHLRWLTTPGAPSPRLGLFDDTAELATAAAVARRAAVAVVFVSDYTTEGADRPSLSLPGDADALIAAVAGANPRTVVVLNTSGPVLMPWLAKVAGLLEAWYPGQQDGNAIAEVLSGAVDPSGRLPVTFPASAAEAPSPSATSGLRPAVAQFGGLSDLGYRAYETRHLTPLFPFGFGLSYSAFALAKPQLVATANGWRLDEVVTNAGRRTGSSVIEAYLDFPGAADEPRQLVATATATLAAGASGVVHLALPTNVFQAWLGGRFTSLPGNYGLVVGRSLTDLSWHLRLGAPDQGAVPLLVNALSD